MNAHDVLFLAHPQASIASAPTPASARLTITRATVFP